MKDIRFALRQLKKNPGFTAVAVAILAVCVGTNLTIFAAIDAILIRPLQFPHSDRLMRLFNSYPKAGTDRANSTIANYYERRDAVPAFSSLSIFGYSSAIVGESGSIQREETMRVSPDFFTTLGVYPAQGRVFHEEETIPGSDDVVLLTDEYWRQHFNADRNVVGRFLTVDGRRRTVIGVLAPAFRFLSSKARLFLPFSSSAEQRSTQRRHYGNGDDIIARLRSGATIEEAQAQVDALNARLGEGDSIAANTGFLTRVVPLQADHVRSVKPVLLLLQAGTLFLLLIGVANLVNLLLVRSSGRAKESSIRLALGANRRHLIQQTMIETVLLTLLGGIVGLAVGAAGIHLLIALGADRLPLGSQVHLDGSLAFTALGGALPLGILMSLPIAWFNLRNSQPQSLRSEARGSTTNQAVHQLRFGFIVVQVALAFVLLSGAGLLGVSFKKAMSVHTGFRADHVLTGAVSLPEKSYPDLAAVVSFTGRLVAEVAGQPGVKAAGAVTVLPLSSAGHILVQTPADVPIDNGDPQRTHQTYGVIGDYFEAMGCTLIKGRFLTTDDSRLTERVCVVDESFAHRYWPDGSALGRQVFQGPQKRLTADAFTIVGIVGDVKQADLTETSVNGAIYFPFEYRATPNLFVVVRTDFSPKSFGSSLAKVVRGIDPSLPVDDLRSMEDRVNDSLETRRWTALLGGIFACGALLLAAVGTYGVLSYAVAQRRREIGVRMALGALPKQIRTQFLKLALRLLAIGTALGVCGSWMAGKAMQNLLFDVPAFHIATMAGAVVIMAVIALGASMLPSHRAASIDPLDALRND